jgi:GNAT superfamily N-acetyltransferase
VDAWARLRVALLLHEDLVAAGAEASRLRTNIAEWLQPRLDSPTFGAFVADLDGSVVGSGGITIYDSPPGPRADSREAYVMSMFTEPDVRGQGIAKAVLTALLDFARAAGGVCRVWLRASEMGRPLYLREGFEPRDSYLVIRL